MTPGDIDPVMVAATAISTLATAYRASLGIRTDWRLYAGVNGALTLYWAGVVARELLAHLSP